ncbi:MAG: hypothetical protein HY553_02640 [Elusimicrobia bacterium]|nr:hypothetical protein [Elusimicrobiota bacterium]
MTDPHLRLRVAVVALAVVGALLWQPLLRPASKGGVILLDVYSTSLWGIDLAALVTPPPRMHDTRETIAGVDMRVTWWRPAWGGHHPGMLLVNGATPAGNDLREIRLISEAIARAGFLVMLPQFPWVTDERFEPGIVGQIDAAFARLRADPATRGRPTGAFGFSVGGGLMLASATQGDALREARYLGVVGAYYDIGTWLASVLSRTQQRERRIVEWEPSDDLPRRASAAVAPIATDETERRALDHVLAAGERDEALRRIGALPPEIRGRLERLSPKPGWSELGSPIFWVHDPKDHYVPVGESEAAAAAPRDGRLVMVVPKLLAHGEPVREETRSMGVVFWVTELGALLSFTMELLRLAS